MYQIFSVRAFGAREYSSSFLLGGASKITCSKRVILQRFRNTPLVCVFFAKTSLALLCGIFAYTIRKTYQNFLRSRLRRSRIFFLFLLCWEALTKSRIRERVILERFQKTAWFVLVSRKPASHTQVRLMYRTFFARAFGAREYFFSFYIWGSAQNHVFVSACFWSIF